MSENPREGRIDLSPALEGEITDALSIPGLRRMTVLREEKRSPNSG